MINEMKHFDGDLDNHLTTEQITATVNSIPEIAVEHSKSLEVVPNVNIIEQIPDCDITDILISWDNL